MPYGYGWLLLDDKNILYAYSFIIIIVVVIYYYRYQYQCKDYSYCVYRDYLISEYNIFSIILKVSPHVPYKLYDFS